MNRFSEPSVYSFFIIFYVHYYQNYKENKPSLVYTACTHVHVTCLLVLHFHSSFLDFDFCFMLIMMK